MSSPFDFLKLATTGSFSARDATEEPLLADPRAQAMELRDRWQRIQQPCTLKPGDLCREKTGLSDLRGNPVLIFWRMLDPTDPIDMAMITNEVGRPHFNRPDCVVGHLRGDSMIAWIAESLLLEPYEPTV